MAQEPAISQFFGFDGLEIVKIDKQAGPVAVADMNGDGLNDLVVVNNFASRIEIHYQKKNASPEDEIARPTRTNELPEHWRFRREFVSVSHRVAAVTPYDFDQDGHIDLIYAGTPPELVFVRQRAPGEFVVTRRHPVRDLGANRSGFALADVMGDDRPELLSLVKGKINVWPLNGDSLGQAVELGAGAAMTALFVEDFNGDGRQDVVGVLPEDAAPVRIWFGAAEDGSAGKKIGPQVRFEMPALREFEPVRIAGEAAARIAVIERASKRMVLYQVDSEPVESSGDREAALIVHSFPDAGNRKRDIAVFDIDGDGLLDLVSTDTESNSLVLYRQSKGRGFGAGEKYPNLSDIDFVVAGNVDDDPYAELFVLSEKEGVVGVSQVGPEGIPFPKPLNIPEGHTPVAMNLVHLESGPHLAVVAKSNREYYAYIIDMKGQRQRIDLGSQSRSPETIIGLDADQDGKTDLLLLTRDRPMTMLYAVDEPSGAPSFKLLESKDMGQFGLVQAARGINTAIMDIDGNGKPELLVADKNYVRAVRYEPTPPDGEGVSPGWQVVRQINANDANAKLVSISLLGDPPARIVAGDRENSRMIIMGKVPKPATADAEGGAPQPPQWQQLESLNVRGFTFNFIRAGAFSGGKEQNVLAVGDDGFAVVSLGGERISLKQFAAWRTDKERRLHHEITVGDVNSDGFTDLVSLDAGEQMLEIFTFSETHKLLYATGFEVFESRIFARGEPREFEPSQCEIADITGDGAADLILTCHDRVLIYPQMTEPKEQAAKR